jgi:hypothetical protein
MTTIITITVIKIKKIKINIKNNNDNSIKKMIALKKKLTKSI